ncbi:MAG: (2Fe-2S) ferredoxin domain-containing protein [Acidobacteriota bacterium]
MPSPRAQILVCVNGRGEGARKASCEPLGALPLYRRFKDEIRSRGIRQQVIVTRTGCLKHCSLGVVVVVQPANHWYREVTTEHIPEIVDSALSGVPVERLLVPVDAPWE